MTESQQVTADRRRWREELARMDPERAEEMRAWERRRLEDAIRVMERRLALLKKERERL